MAHLFPELKTQEELDADASDSFFSWRGEFWQIVRKLTPFVLAVMIAVALKTMT